MSRARVQILVVDDEPAQGKAVTEALTRAGYAVTFVRSSTEAAQIAARQEFHALIIDCMLPLMNGVVLVEQINAISVNKPYALFYSGVFKDKAFQRDAMERTGAAGFLTKPFPLDEMLDLVNARFTETNPAAVDPLAALYGARTLSATELTDLFTAAPTVPGVHLPMIYRRLQIAGLSGELSMVTQTGDLNTVSFHSGRIFNVHTPDRLSAFGALSIGLGLVTAEDLDHALRSPERKMIGQKLIESVAMSPHALELVMQEQLALRLSQTIEDGALTLNWTHREFPEPDCVLSLERYQTLADDWTRSKIDAAWIRDYLVGWGAFEITGPAHPRLEPALLDDLLSHASINDDVDLPFLLRQLINGNVTLRARQVGSDYRFLETRLTHLLHLYPAQSHFEILGLGEKAHSLEINRAFEDLRRSFDPANLAEDCPPRVMLKATQVFKFILTAHEVLADELSRNRYVMLQLNKRGQIALENEPKFRQAAYLVANGRAAEAAEIFQELLDQKIHFPDLRAYRIWAGFAVERRFKHADFDKIAPEERHSAPYHVARGLYHKSLNQTAKAVESFSAALIMEPRLAFARAELEIAQKLAEARTGRTLLREIGTSLGLKIRRGA